MGFLYRGAECFITAIAMNVIYLTMTYRLARNQPKAFFTLGIFGSSLEKKEDDQKIRVLDSIESVPHIWYMSIQLTLVFLYANADINSRVASTLPIYYWGFASLVTESKGKMANLARFACWQNLIYMCYNVCWFSAEIGFY